MRRFFGLVGFFCWMWALAGVSFGADYKLINGDIVRGEAASFNDDGFIVRLAAGGFSPRIGWGKLTQETLKEMANIPAAQKFVEPFIEIPVEIKEQARRERKKEIVVKEPEKPLLPTGKEGFFASLMNPLGWLLLGLVYAANLYAAFEVALFRSRSPLLVMGVSAILPILGPLIFALMPTAPAVAAPLPEPMTQEPAGTPAEQKVAGPSGMGLAAHAGAPSAASNPAYNQIYNRSNSTFDRRFFETKFTGFFRVVPSDAEKDMVLVIKAAKAVYVGRRVSRISMNEIHVQLQQGGSEVSVPFGEIIEVSVRHKDAK